MSGRLSNIFIAQEDDTKLSLFIIYMCSITILNYNKLDTEMWLTENVVSNRLVPHTHVC